VLPAIYILIAKDHSKDRLREAAVQADAGNLKAAHA
jgi:hypothetical protein